eukprot:sb/3461539/
MRDQPTYMGVKLSNRKPAIITERQPNSTSWIIHKFASSEKIDASYRVTVTSNVTTPFTLVKRNILFSGVVPTTDRIMHQLDKMNPGVERKTEPVRSNFTTSSPIRPDGFATELRLLCKAVGTSDLARVEAYWTLNDVKLDLRDGNELSYHIRYENPENKETDATILVEPSSAVVAGFYKCTVGNGYQLSYNLTVIPKTPPESPKRVYVTEIKYGEEVVASADLPTSYNYMGDNVSFDGVGRINGVNYPDLLRNWSVTQNNVLTGTFDISNFSSVKNIEFECGFIGRNQYGSSDLSLLSELVAIKPGTPRFSPTWIRTSPDRTVTSEKLIVDFGIQPQSTTKEYDVRLLDSEAAVVRNVVTMKTNEIQFEGLYLFCNCNFPKRCSAVIAGFYKCTVGNGYQLSYNLTVIPKTPPESPKRVHVTEIKHGEEVVASADLPTSYNYMGDNVSFDGVARINGVNYPDLLRNWSVTQNNVLTGTFDISNFSSVKNIEFECGFIGRNQYGSSDLSLLSELVAIKPGTPRFSPTWIRTSPDRTVTSEKLIVDFGIQPQSTTKEYDVRLLDSEAAVVRNVVTMKTNEIQFEGLEAETEYGMLIRGVNRTTEGDAVYGPVSSLVKLLTAPETLNPPSNLEGTPLESDGEKSSVLLTWEPPVVSIAGLIQGYQLVITPDDETRNRRQALQMRTIPYGQSMRVVSDLRSGTRYSFSLSSYSDTFGESEPASVTVETLRSGECPFTSSQLYHPIIASTRGNGEDYQGSVNKTKSGKPCVSWPKEYGMNHNQCRNPNGEKDVPWCFTDEERTEVCPVRSCTGQPNQDCFTGRGYFYEGPGNTVKCDRWTLSSLKEYNLTSTVHQTKILGEQNGDEGVCRNWPGSSSTEPWCLVKGTPTNCNVPSCGYLNATLSINGTRRTVENYQVPKPTVCLCLKKDASLSKNTWLNYRRSFGIENCESPSVDAAVDLGIGRVTGIWDRVWVRYLILEGVLLLATAVFWGFLLTRARVIERRLSKVGSYPKTLSSRLTFDTSTTTSFTLGS